MKMTEYTYEINDEAMEKRDLITQIDEMQQQGDVGEVKEMKNRIARIERNRENEKVKVSKTVVMLLKQEYRRTKLHPNDDAIRDATKKLYNRIRITENGILFDKGEGVQVSLLENGKWRTPTDYGKVLGKEFINEMDFDTSMDSVKETSNTFRESRKKLNRLDILRFARDKITAKETIEMIDTTKKNVDVAIQTLEQQSFVRDDGVLVPMRELKGLDESLTTQGTNWTDY